MMHKLINAKSERCVRCTSCLDILLKVIISHSVYSYSYSGGGLVLDLDDYSTEVLMETIVEVSC